MSDERLTNKLFEINLKYELTWSNGIAQTLEEIGQNQIFVNICVCNLRLCKERLREQQENVLLREIRNKPKLRLFKDIKTDSKTAEYLLHYLNGHGVKDRYKEVI